MATLSQIKSVGIRSALLVGMFFAFCASAHASGKAQPNPPRATSDAQKAKSKATTTAARVAVGTAVGGAAGKVIMGGPRGTAIGILLTPSEIGCGAGETCRRGK